MPHLDKPTFARPGTQATARALCLAGLLTGLIGADSAQSQGVERGGAARTVAHEGEAFVITGTATVRYGADAHWIERNVSGSATCSNTFFGGDPLVGVKKSCVVGATAPPPAHVRPGGRASATLGKAAAEDAGRIEEGQTFTANPPQVFRYGAEDRWTAKQVAGPASCTNAFFGTDPAPGVKKRCEPASGTPLAAAPPPAPVPMPAATPLPPAAAWGTPRNRARFFVSGHSLTDDPYAANIADIARGLLGPTAAEYNQQIVIGSPIRGRTGMPGDLAGYSTGKNRQGQGLDILRELQTGTTIRGERYDALIITENHNLLQNMQWENTVKQVRHFHEQYAAANPLARTFLHASWWSIDKRNPGAWLAAERTVSKAWECSAARVNLSLAAEGRPDRVRPLPTSLALATLVEQALSGQVPGVSTAQPQTTLNRIFQDNVHLTPLGTYYLALVTYAAVYERSPEGAPPVAGVSPEQARALQALAWRFTSHFYAGYSDPSMQACNTRWMPLACESYWSERERPGDIVGCKALFQAANRDNPLYHHAGTDADFWFPARP